MRIVSAGTQGKGGGDVGETRATRWALRPPRCGDVQPSLAGAAVSGASGGIGSRHSDTRHQTPTHDRLKDLMLDDPTWLFDAQWIKIVTCNINAALVSRSLLGGHNLQQGCIWRDMQRSPMHGCPDGRRLPPMSKVCLRFVGGAEKLDSSLFAIRIGCHPNASVGPFNYPQTFCRQVIFFYGKIFDESVLFA